VKTLAQGHRRQKWITIFLFILVLIFFVARLQFYGALCKRLSVIQGADILTAKFFLRCSLTSKKVWNTFGV